MTDGSYNYTYDDEGNRTKRVEIATGKVTEYVWDYRNRLTSVLFKDGAGVVTKTIEYVYDGNDRRIGKRIDGAVSERYVYDGSDIALVFDGAGNQTHRYLHGTGIDTVLADERGGAVVWALADNQGTIRDVVDGNGTILNHVTYDSFGKVQGQSNAGVEFRYGYTGREADTETGLDYYRARYYDASNGRFISEDPIGFEAGDGNLTRYVGNSPTNFNDPSGLCPLLAAPAIAPAIPPIIYWLAGILGAGGIIASGLNNSAPSPYIGPPNEPPEPLPPFPLPIPQRPEDYIYRQPAFPSPPDPLQGYPNVDPYRNPLHTGHGRPDYSAQPGYSGIFPPFLESQNHHGIPWNNNTYNHGDHPLVTGAGADLKSDPRHQIELENHAGRHSPTYHDEIQTRMDNAYNALPTGATQAEHDRVLGQVMNDVLTDIRNGSLKPYDHKDVWEPKP